MKETCLILLSQSIREVENKIALDVEGMAVVIALDMDTGGFNGISLEASAGRYHDCCGPDQRRYVGGRNYRLRRRCQPSGRHSDGARADGR